MQATHVGGEVQFHPRPAMGHALQVPTPLDELCIDPVWPQALAHRTQVG